MEALSRAGRMPKSSPIPRSALRVIDTAKLEQSPFATYVISLHQGTTAKWCEIDVGRASNGFAKCVSFSDDRVWDFDDKLSGGALNSLITQTFCSFASHEEV